MSGWAISVDARVFIALDALPEGVPIECIAMHANICFDDMRAALRRLALRLTPGPTSIGKA